MFRAAAATASAALAAGGDVGAAIVGAWGDMVEECHCQGNTTSRAKKAKQQSHQSQEEPCRAKPGAQVRAKQALCIPPLSQLAKPASAAACSSEAGSAVTSLSQPPIQRPCDELDWPARGQCL